MNFTLQTAPKCKRFHRRCDDFSICVNIGEKGYVLAEHPNEIYTTFYYGLYGAGIFGRLFSKEDPLILDAAKNEIVNVQEYMNDKVAFEATEDFHMIGFNTLDKNIKWEAKILTQENEIIKVPHHKYYLICVNGKPSVNEKTFKRYDYSSLVVNKEYEIMMEDNDVLILFNQII